MSHTIAPGQVLVDKPWWR